LGRIGNATELAAIPYRTQAVERQRSARK
jgi:hypothetical protein